MAAQGDNADGRAGGVGTAEVDHDAAVALVAAVLGEIDGVIVVVAVQDAEAAVVGAADGVRQVGVVHVAPGSVVLIVGLLDLQLDLDGFGQGGAGGADGDEQQAGAEALHVHRRGEGMRSVRPLSGVADHLRLCSGPTGPPPGPSGSSFQPFFLMRYLPGPRGACSFLPDGHGSP